MRLAALLGRTLAELDRTMGADELALWQAFAAEFDLPDGFLVTERVASAVVASLSGKAPPPGSFAPYYLPPPADDGGPPLPDVNEQRARFLAMRGIRSG